MDGPGLKKTVSQAREISSFCGRILGSRQAVRLGMPITMLWLSIAIPLRIKDATDHKISEAPAIRNRQPTLNTQTDTFTLLA